MILSVGQVHVRNIVFYVNGTSGVLPHQAYDGPCLFCSQCYPQLLQRATGRGSTNIVLICCMKMAVGENFPFFSGGAEKETFLWFKKKRRERKLAQCVMVLNDNEKDSRRLLSIYNLGKVAQTNL